MANFFGALGQLGATALPGLIDQYEKQREQKTMLGLFANRPEMAQAYYGAVNDANTAKTGGQDPSAVREYQYWNSLTPAQKEEYLRVKRSQQIIDLGGTQGVLAPVGEGLSQEFVKTPKITETPEYQAAQEGAKTQAQLDAELAGQPAVTAAVKQAEVAGEAAGELGKKQAQAVNVLGLVEQAKLLLPKATSGGVATAVKGGKALFNVSDEATQADAGLKAIAAALTSNVPRFEGPQGVLDVELYKQAAGDVANTNIPTEDRLAALDTIQSLNEKYTGKQSIDPAAARAELIRRGLIKQ